MMPENPEPETLLFETSPFGTIDALVEQDERCAYLYLHSKVNPSFGTRAVWLRNLIRGPLIFSDEDLQAGIPPVLPRTYCGHPDGEAPLIANRLKLVWFEEGNGVALFLDDDLFAVIPPWSGFDGFHGYARDCRTDNQVCWPLPSHDQLLIRIRRAAQYWKRWESSNPFQMVQPTLIERLAKKLGSTEKYFAIDGNQWPPRGLQVFRQPTRTNLATIGVGLCSMPNVELAVEEPAAIRRIELAMQVASCDADQIDVIAGWMSGVASYPWRHLTWLGSGHTFPLNDGMSSLWKGLYSAVLLVDQSHLGFDIQLDHFQNDPVNLIWMVPITESELHELREEADHFPSLLDRLKAGQRLPLLD